MKRLLIPLATALFTTAACAQYVNGNTLLSDLRGGSNDRMFALGYIAGVADAYDENAFCLPPRTQLGQIRDIVTKFLEENPKDRHNHAGVLVLVPLMESYPCKKGGGV